MTKHLGQLYVCTCTSQIAKGIDIKSEHYNENWL
jgi:hypothetical protein